MEWEPIGTEFRLSLPWRPVDLLAKVWVMACNKLGYLPSAVAHNDFIFAVLAEESGLLGSALALLAILLVIFGCLKVATKASDRFGAMLAVSVSVLLMTHVFVRVGMTIGITPITGLPSFFELWRTFLVTCFLMLGVVQSVYRHRKEFR